MTFITDEIEIKDFNKFRSYRLSPHSKVKDRLDVALQFIVEHTFQRISIDDIASEAAVSKFHLIRCFKNEFGVTPIQFHLILKMNKAKEILTVHPKVNVKEVAIKMGYPDIFSFSKYFKKVMGFPPSKFTGYLQCTKRKNLTTVDPILVSYSATL